MTGGSVDGVAIVRKNLLLAFVSQLAVEQRLGRHPLVKRGCPRNVIRDIVTEECHLAG